MSARCASKAEVMGQALSLAIDRVAIVNFILQKTGEPAGGLLPQWSSGTAFLFPAAAPSAADLEHAKELSKEIAASGPLLLGYDSADPLEQSVAERIVVNAKEAGMRRASAGDAWCWRRCGKIAQCCLASWARGYGAGALADDFAFAGELR